MLKQVYQASLSDKGRCEPLGLRPSGLLQRQTLGVWLRKKLSWRLAKVVDDGLNLSSLLLVFDRLQVYVVLVRVIVEEVAGLFCLRACLLVPEYQVDPVVQVSRYILGFLYMIENTRCTKFLKIQYL